MVFFLITISPTSFDPYMFHCISPRGMVETAHDAPRPATAILLSDHRLTEFSPFLWCPKTSSLNIAFWSQIDWVFSPFSVCSKEVIATLVFDHRLIEFSPLECAAFLLRSRAHTHIHRRKCIYSRQERLSIEKRERKNKQTKNPHLTSPHA